MATKREIDFLGKLFLKFISEQDPLLSMLEWLIHQLMMIEAERKAGAAKGERSENRKTYFSGTRVRRFDTRMGTMYLLVPKLRKGGYVPFFITHKKRSETALLQVIQEAYINGVSTRKIERLAQSLGIENISASQVSEINRELDQRIREFKNRPLDTEYPAIWVDANYQKIRIGHKCVNSAAMVVCGVNMRGKREILAVKPMLNESEETYLELFEEMKQRGLKRVWLCVSDAHAGLKQAISKSFLGCSWQRCKVHFMRNILAHIPASEKEVFAGKLKQIWLQPDYESAVSYANQLMEKNEKVFPQAIHKLEKGLEDSLQYYQFDMLDYRKTASTNVLERLNREIRRRANVVGVFPSMNSYERLLISYLIEYEDEWSSSGKDYISFKKLARQKEALEISA